MPAELRDVRQCLRCGKVTGDIWAPHRKVHVEKDAVLIRENPLGEDLGYTQSGKLIRGDIVDSYGKFGACEVYQEHLCGVDKEARADGQGQAGTQNGRRWGRRR